MRHLGTQILTTERLILRPLTVADAITMFENWASDPQVTRFLRWEPHKDWLETAQLLAGWEALYPNPDYYQWGVCLRGSDAPFGSISVMEGEEQNPALWRTPGLDHSAGVGGGLLLWPRLLGQGLRHRGPVRGAGFLVPAGGRAVDGLLPRGGKPRQRPGDGKSRLGVGSRQHLPQIRRHASGLPVLCEPKPLISDLII